ALHPADCVELDLERAGESSAERLRRPHCDDLLLDHLTTWASVTGFRDWPSARGGSRPNQTVPDSIENTKCCASSGESATVTVTVPGSCSPCACESPSPKVEDAIGRYTASNCAVGTRTAVMVSLPDARSPRNV